MKTQRHYARFKPFGIANVSSLLFLMLTFILYTLSYNPLWILMKNCFDRHINPYPAKNLKWTYPSFKFGQNHL